MFKLDLNRAARPLQMLRALLASALMAVVAVPAVAFHFPWDQGHDTTQSNDPNAPGPDDRDPNDPDCNRNSGRSPVYATNGQAFWRATDVVLRGRPFIGIYRVYNCADPVIGMFGNGWSVDFDIALYPANRSGVQLRIFKAANGKRFAYTKQPDGTFKAPDSRFDTITEGAGTVTMTALDGRRSIFAIDGRLLQRVDANGNVVSFSYDTLLRLNGIADGLGRSLALAYNGQGFVSTVTDHAGRIWRYSYDALGNLTRVTNPAGGITAYTWQSFKPPADAQTYYQLLSVTDPSGVSQVTFAYTANQVASYTEGANRHTYTRNANNTKLSGTVTKRDALNVATSFNYGALGLVTRDVDGIGGITSYTYDSNGRVTTTTDALGRAWSSSYDALGRLTVSSNPLGQSSSIQYTGSDPRPVRMTSPSGRVVAMTYDARGNLLTTTDPANAITRMAYSARGDLTGITNALNQSTSVVYNAIGLPVQVTDSLGRVSTMSYDALGRLAVASNAASEATRYTYDVLDRVTAVVDPLNQTTAFSYDAAGRLTSVTDAKGSVTQYQYDGFGRRSAEIAPDGRRTTYAYRADNLLSTITWPDNTTISYLYDNNKRVTRETAGSEVINYSYNAVNQLTSAAGPGGTVSYTYDNAGRVVTETSGGRTNTIVRNAEGERIRLDYLGQSQTYTRDARGLVTRIAAPAGNFDFSFDALGRRTQLAYPNGSTASYAFDAAGQLTSLTHAGVFNAPYAHTFDAAGRITRITGDGPDWNYSYDVLGRLTRASQAATSYTYTLDPVGNILDGGRSHDVNHRLTADASKNYSYDQRGNLTLETDIASGGRVVYGWNVKNQLLRVDFLADAVAVTPTRTLQFSYDPFGRRASKTDNGNVEKFVYEGDDLIGVLNAGNSVISSNVYSGSIDEPLASITGAATKTLHANHLGSITGVVEGSTLTHSYRYGPYGQTLAGSSADSTPFRFTARERDTDSLVYYRSRYYHSGINRFISPDPAGTPDGPNRYSYVGGDPINNVDPSGKFCIPCALAIAWGVAELGASAYDLFDAARTALDPCASGGEKGIAIAGAMLGVVGPGGGYGTAAKAASKAPMWTAKKGASAVENAFGHWQKHGSEFPEFKNAKQYVEGARDFFSNPPPGTLTKTRPNGDTLFYNPGNNTFGVQAGDGAPRTMFRPTDGMNYWNKQ